MYNYFFCVAKQCTFFFFLVLLSGEDWHFTIITKEGLMVKVEIMIGILFFNYIFGLQDKTVNWIRIYEVVDTHPQKGKRSYYTVVA